MATYSASISKIEAAEIKRNLKLRFNTLYDCHEVYTTIHGSGVFNWMQCTRQVAAWYEEHFGLSVESYLQPSLRTGGIIESSAKTGSSRDVYDKG